jgi:hypothetical protein
MTLYRVIPLIDLATPNPSETIPYKAPQITLNYKIFPKMSYNLTTLCIGQKYTPIVQHWLNRVKSKCPTADQIQIWTESHIKNTNIDYRTYAWWDIIRLHNNLELLIKTKKPVVHCDLDNIIEKDIQPLVDLPYDIIISTEIGGAKAFPQECTSKLGFGVCSGFYVIKPSAMQFILDLYRSMETRKYNSYSDQVNMMNIFVNTPHEITTEPMDGGTSTNRIIHINGIKICVLDFQAVIRDPIYSQGQYANHINIDNVGGPQNFIRYFYEKLEDLPLTCRCGKLGDTNPCTHYRSA